MATPVIMPKFEMSQETALVIEWLKDEGDQVEKGEPLLSVETDKVTMDVEAPASGTLAGVSVSEDEDVPVTTTIAYILDPGEALPEEAEPEQPTDAEAAVSAPSKPKVTPVAERLAETYDVDLTEIEGTGPGGKIVRADVEAAQEAAQAAEDEAAAEPANVRATPAARRIARERDVDLHAIEGTGPRGRVQAADVRDYQPTPEPEAAPPAEAEVVPLKGMRKTIAERMTASYRTAPHITLTVRVQMQAFNRARTVLNAKAEAEGAPHISATALIAQATAWALRRHPRLNSNFHKDGIHLLSEINLGIATAVEDGLIVPVVRNADRKGLGQLAEEINALVERARSDALTPADVAEGTFTLSNLGPFGVEQFTAIINPPQAAILAIGAIQNEGVDDGNGQLVLRPVLRLTLSADHRIVDGAQAAVFLSDLRAALENPTLILL
jgi:pyruvate dehydrogenase E2 component (dihydrolipoamide acetyltransferase)